MIVLCVGVHGKQAPQEATIPCVRVWVWSVNGTRQYILLLDAQTNTSWNGGPHCKPAGLYAVQVGTIVVWVAFVAAYKSTREWMFFLSQQRCVGRRGHCSSSVAGSSVPLPQPV